MAPAGKLVAALLRSWSELTLDEQRACLVVLSLFALGLVVRLWHACAAPG